MTSLYKRISSALAPVKRPKVSVIVIAYNMAREVPRTVKSLLPPYQTGLDLGDVEIIVLDNGSPVPIPEQDRANWPDVVRYEYIEDAHRSPAKALNYGVKLARADWIGVMIDGARMLTPGVLSQSLKARGLHASPVIATLGFHLGHKQQQISTQEGYDQDEEDRLLETIAWPDNGYKLFDISCLGQSAELGWYGPVAESNAIFMPKALYTQIGGYDERFESAGGGIVNLDFFKRLVEDERNSYILLYAEGSFHQHHGGVTTSNSNSDRQMSSSATSKWDLYAAEYKSIHHKDYSVPERKPLIFGTHHDEVFQTSMRVMDTYRRKQAKSSKYQDYERVQNIIDHGEHRDVIGGLWDELGRLQTDFLIAQGLEKHHHIIDIGCGSLRAGLPLTLYLDADRFFGIDSHQGLLDAGYDREIIPAGLGHKLPRTNLFASDSFDISRFDKTFDFGIAQSVFTHMPLSYLEVCLNKIRPYFAKGGQFFVTYFECPLTRDPSDPFIHERGGITSYPDRDPFHIQNHRLQELTPKGWALDIIGDWGHPRDQRMAKFIRIE